jgi:hypothetical protein
MAIKFVRQYLDVVTFDSQEKALLRASVCNQCTTTWKMAWKPGPQPVYCFSTPATSLDKSINPSPASYQERVCGLEHVGYQFQLLDRKRLGMQIQEILAERTRDFTLTGSGAGYYDTGEEKMKNVRSQLDSGSDREKLSVSLL